MNDIISRTKSRNYLLILIAVLFLTLPACAGVTKRLESPTVHIVDIKVKDIKALEASFNVQLRVLNPNDIPIIAKGINCDIEINDIHLATGVSSTAVEIPAFGTEIVAIEVFSSAFDVIKSIISLSDEDILRYKIKGRLRLEGGPFMLSRIPFKSEGDLNVKGIMEKQ
ncbi:MAG: LEA type 2 family protein [Deltaproteobacteria bacterium]|nr:LEA type 2 family protein [Deltaproteobacteria bacterium]